VLLKTLDLFKVCGTSCSLSWVFNKGDRIHVTTLHLLWPEKNYSFQEGGSKLQMEEGKDLLCTFPFYYMYLVVKMHVCLIYKSGAKAVLEAAL